ncbi:MAG: DUF4270 family protein, partial [Gemmatimonadaceae bacterium]|nr:DUF4270 family protein [Chitinophagaceae bacterium]
MNKFYLVLCLSFVVIFANPSCTKIDTTTLGGDLIPVIDNVNTFETFLDVITNLESLPDSTRILSTTGTADDHALGRINGDLSFGSTTADIYMAIGTNSTSPIMPFGPKDSIMAIDSVVLQLAYTGQFGDSTSVAQIQVREINPAVKFDYPVNKDTIIVGYKIDTLNSANGNGFGTTAALGPVHNQDFSRFKDQYTLRRSSSDTEVVSNVMRIPLSNTLGQRLAGYDTVGATAPFRSDSLFRTYFRGMQIRATSISSALGGA